MHLPAKVHGISGVRTSRASESSEAPTLRRKVQNHTARKRAREVTVTAVISQGEPSQTPSTFSIESVRPSKPRPVIPALRSACGISW